MIQETIQKDQVSALKSGDKEKLSTLRYIVAQIKNKEIDKKGRLTDEEVIEALRKVAKEIRESIEAFRKGNRQDLVEQHKKQLEIVSSYLPAELSDEDLKKEIEKIIESNKDLYKRNPKAIIGISVKQLKPKAASSRIVKILQSYETR